MGTDWAREWTRWCATTRASGTPTPQYAAIRLEGWGQHTGPRLMVHPRGGPERPWDAAATEWRQAAPEPQMGWEAMCPRSPKHPSPPASCPTP